MKPPIYLACPYSHPDKEVREQRFRAANRAAGNLMQEGLHVYSPISHTHPIAVECELPKGWDYWEAFDRIYISFCYKIVVLKIEGWEQSKGVRAEMAIAKEMNIPIEFMEEV